MRKFILFLSIISSFGLYAQNNVGEINITVPYRETAKKVNTSTVVPAPIGPYSQGVQAGNMLFVSGQIALDSRTGKIIEGDIKAEAEGVMKNVKAVIEEAGFEMRNIVKTTIYLTDIASFKTVNEVYATFFSGNYPARETVQVVALPKGARVEISVIAVR